MNLNSKKDFQDLMHLFLDPLKKHYSDGGARLRIKGAGASYKEITIELEAFSRPLWALAPFWFGGGTDKEFEEIYKKGFKNGVDPKSEDYWDGFTDYDQRFVEMAAMSSALVLCKDKLFDFLSDENKSNLEAWLNQINNHTIPQNNWYFFRVTVNVALKKCGLKYDAELLEKDLQDLESYYLSEGWYKDGPTGHIDYYVPFGMHYFGLMYSVMMGEEDPERCKRFKERATIFANEFLHFFANDGSAIPYGRSLTYRFAQCSFFSACVFAGLDIDLGVAKGIITRHFDYWLKQDIVDNGGVLTVGYAYPNLFMSEIYNAKGSPYWSMLTFVILGLSDEHEFWKIEAKPLPTLSNLKCFKPANMIVQRLNDGDNAILYMPAELELYSYGTYLEKYSKFAYSTKFGFSVMRSSATLQDAAPDSMLAFVIDGNVFVRKTSKAFEVFEEKITSTWSPFIGIDVKTTITFTEKGHIRHHEIESAYDCIALDCGFSLPKFVDDYAQTVDKNTAKVSGNNLCCEVKSLTDAGVGVVQDCFPNTNILFKNTTIPAVKYDIVKGKTEIKTEISL